MGDALATSAAAPVAATPMAEANSGPSVPSGIKTAATNMTASRKLMLAKMSSRPSTSAMVNAAIVALDEKNGSSLQAIKTYIVGNYLLDGDKQTPLIKKYLKTAIENKTIVQTKGVGASGRFKLASNSKTAEHQTGKQAQGAKGTDIGSKKNTTKSKPKSSKPKITKETKVKPAASTKKSKKASTESAKKSKVKKKVKTAATKSKK